MRTVQRLQNKTQLSDIGNTDMQFVFGEYQSCEKVYQMQKKMYIYFPRSNQAIRPSKLNIQIKGLLILFIV